MNFKHNYIKDISFKTDYSVAMFVEGNTGIKFKYLYFLLSKYLGISDPPTDYLKIVTDINPTETQAHALLEAVESGETYIDIEKLFIKYGPVNGYLR